MKITATVTPELRADLKAAVTQFKVGMAAEVRDELTTTAQDAIVLFYKHYDPTSYHRHLPLMQNLNKSFISYYSNPHNQIVRGGIELVPGNMDEIYYHASAELVWNTTFIAGMHGNIHMANPSAYSPAPMNPSPYAMILNKRDYMLNHIQTFSSTAYTRMKAGQYTYLKIK